MRTGAAFGTALATLAIPLALLLGLNWPTLVVLWVLMCGCLLVLVTMTGPLPLSTGVGCVLAAVAAAWALTHGILARSSRAYRTGGAINPMFAR